MAIPSTPVIGTKYSFGTLYLNNVLKAKPTVTNAYTPGSGAVAANASCNIPVYSSGNIEVRDTDATAANQLSWVYVERGGKKMFVCDRNIVNTVSWSALDTQSLIFGKEVTIDGQLFKICSLTAGTASVTTVAYQINGTTVSPGTLPVDGTPTTNEWDSIINNTAAISGLTTPAAADKDGNFATADLTSAHNVAWNWAGTYSWCQDTATFNSSNRVIRGYYSARLWNAYPAPNAYAYVGFRPCLEILNSAPLVSDSDRSLGSLASAPSVSYSVSEADGDKFSILETLDGTTLRSLTNQSSGTQYTIDLSSVWATLANGSHTLLITATDTKGAASTRTITFTKTNTAPGIPTLNSPVNNMRIPASGYVVFTPAADPDGDAQTFKVQIAANTGFTTSLQTFTTGLQRNDSGTWTSVSSVVSGDIGKQFRMPFSGVALNATKYVRVVSSDGNTTTNSATVTVKSGDTLDIQTFPDARATKPNSVKVFLRGTIDPAASIQVLACNNGNDATPTWENITTDYQAGAAHTFTNASKTASQWGLAVRAIITANAATGEISISAVGMGVN